MRPKREGRSKGSRALAIGDEAGRTDRLGGGSLTFEYEKGSSNIFSMYIPLNDLQAQFASIKPEVMSAIEGVLDSMHLFLGPQNRRFEQSFASYCGCAYGVGVSNGTDAITLTLRACHIGAGDEVITVSHSFIATVEAIAQVGATPVFVDIEPDTYTLDWRRLEGALSERTRAIIPVHVYGHPADMHPLLDFAREHGSRVRYQHEILGANARMDEVQAAIVNVKMAYLDG